MRNVTITNNTAETGGGIFISVPGNQFIPLEISLGNTIVAGNIATTSFPEIRYEGGKITSEGNNLVGDSQGDSTNTGINSIAYQSTDIRDVNPMLGLLQNNGGTTPTHALLFGSPAIDTGNNCVYLGGCPSGVPPFALLTDQRGAGFTRSADGNGDIVQIVDIGAYELQLAPTAAAIEISGRVTLRNGDSIEGAIVTITDSKGGATLRSVTNARGFYQFTDVQAGGTYILSISANGYNFSQSTQVLSLTETSEINFIATEVKSRKRVRFF